MDKPNYAISFATVSDMLAEINRKHPNFLNEEVQKDVLSHLIEITTGDKQEVSFVKKEKIGDRHTSFELAFKITVHNEIELNMYRLHSKTGERRILTKRLFVIRAQACVKDIIVEHINSLLQKGMLTISIHAVLMKNYSSLDQSLRNKIKQYHYEDETGNLFLHFPNGVTIIIPAKGVTMTRIIVRQPEYTEFKITQKYLPTIHYILNHHLTKEDSL